jgi:hypothetical protein
MAKGYMKRSLPKVFKRDGALQYSAQENMGA